jgi:polyisoprenoid-binding protein YceI
MTASMRQTALLLAFGLLFTAGATRAAETPAAVTPAAPSSDPTQVRPGAYVLDSAHGKITWSVSHLGFSTYYGQITDVTAQAVLDPKEPAKSTLTVTIGTDSVNGLDDRLNQHLKAPDFFDTAKFPKATFTATGLVTPFRVRSPLTRAVVGLVGSMPVAFDATFNQAGINPVNKAYTVGFDGRAVIKRSDFGINAFLPLLGDEVSLRLEGEFKAVE